MSLRFASLLAAALLAGCEPQDNDPDGTEGSGGTDGTDPDGSDPDGSEPDDTEGTEAPVKSWTCPADRQILLRTGPLVRAHLGATAPCVIDPLPGEVVSVVDDGAVVTVDGAADVWLGADMTVLLGPDLTVEPDISPSEESGLKLDVGPGQGSLTTVAGHWTHLTATGDPHLSYYAGELGALVHGAFDLSFENDAPTDVIPAQGTSMMADDYSINGQFKLDFSGKVSARLDHAFGTFACLEAGSSASHTVSNPIESGITSCEDLGSVAWGTVHGTTSWSGVDPQANSYAGEFRGDATLSLSYSNIPTSLDSQDPETFLVAEYNGPLIELQGPGAFDVTPPTYNNPVTLDHAETRVSDGDPAVGATLRWYPQGGEAVELPPLTTWDWLTTGLVVEVLSGEALVIPVLAEPADKLTLSTNGDATLGLEVQGKATVSLLATADLDLEGFIAEPLSVEAAESASIDATGATVTALTVTSGPGPVGATWTVAVGTGVGGVSLQPGGDTAVTLSLPAGAYTFACPGPCPALPEGITDGVGPFVELVPEVGWSGALVLSLSP